MFSRDVMVAMDKKDYPDYVIKCLKKMDEVNETKYWREGITVDTYFKRVFISLDDNGIQCDYFRAWAIMKVYYGFEVTYEDGLFKIGGYETEQLTSRTLLGLIKKLEKLC